jgi:hypothetical protein
LHKGDSGNGLFIQIIGKVNREVPIPVTATGTDSQISFGVLRDAQSLGDREALIKEGRQVIRIELGDNALTDIHKLIDAVSI